MKKKTDNKDKKKSNPIVSGLIKAFFDLINHFIKDFDNMRKINKIDKFSEEFSTMEHMLIRLERKLDDNRHQIEDLKNRILWGNLIIIVLILINLFYWLR